MKLYAIIIGIANLVIMAANILWHGNVPLSLLAPPAATVFVIALDGVGAALLRKLPERFFSPDRRVFVAGKKERNFYRCLKIKKWKAKIPELGGFTNFHKDKIESKTDKQYLRKFLLEINYGVIIHLQNAVFGFLTMLLPFPLSVTLLVAIVNFVLSLMPMAVLRYNGTVLKELYIKQKTVR